MCRYKASTTDHKGKVWLCKLGHVHGHVASSMYMDPHRSKKLHLGNHGSTIFPSVFPEIA